MNVSNLPKIIKLQGQSLSRTWIFKLPFYHLFVFNEGFSGGAVVKNPPANAEDRFDPWVRKIPWSRKQQPAPVFLPGKFHGQRRTWRVTVHGITKSQTQPSD